MIIKKINYRVYGKLIDRELVFHDGLNVIYGENEAGKSTIFNSISSLFYGFKPTNREKHPYVNWEKNEINFSSEILNSKELFLVERSLKSTPKFNLIQLENHTTNVFRNESLPFISNVSEVLFETVFHLTSEHLNQVEKESWTSIQEKLIFNYGTDYLNKASDVILQLEQEINSLWRKDKRGNPLINQIQSEINELKLKRSDAEKYYERIRLHTDRLDVLDHQILMAEQKKQSYEIELKKCRSLLPIKELIDRIETLENSLFKPIQFKTIDPKLLEMIEALKSKVEESDRKLVVLKDEKQKIASDLIIFTETDRRLIDFKKESERLEVFLADLLRLEQEEHTKLEELVKLRERIASQYKLLFEGDINEGIKNGLKSILVLDLMSLIQKYAEGYEKNEAYNQDEKSKRKSANKRYLGLGLAGGISIISGILFETFQFLLYLGSGLVAYAMAKVDFTGKQTHFEQTDLKQLEQKITSQLNGIQLPEYVWRDNSLRFFSKLEQLIMMLHDEDQLHAKWESLIEKQNELESEIAESMKSKQFDTTRGAKLSLQFVKAQIERLVEIEAAEVKKRTKIELLDSQLTTGVEEHSVLQKRYESLIQNVTHFGDGNTDLGFEKIKSNSEIQRKIKLYQDELSTHQFDLESLENVSDNQIQLLEKELESIVAEEKIVIAEQNSIKNEILKYNEMSNLDDINSLILSGEERLEELVELRNRKMILLELIKFSDERFRLENQPNIITRVSEFMRRMTKGKYQEVLISEENGHFELQFLIKGEIIPVTRAFSKGTLQQLFFAFRLAVIEALDPEHHLPFVLDEAFVNWDMHRFTETMHLLLEISKERQVLFFTCHSNLVNKISELDNVNVVEVNV